MSADPPATGACASAVNLASVLGSFQEQWAPRIVARLNDTEFKLAKLEGEFVCHAHADTDEAFLVLQGSLIIRLEDREVKLHPGELFVVPRGVRHQPVANHECHVLLIEAAETLNTGDAETKAYSSQGVWVQATKS